MNLNSNQLLKYECKLKRHIHEDISEYTIPDLYMYEHVNTITIYSLTNLSSTSLFATMQKVIYAHHPMLCVYAKHIYT